MARKWWLALLALVIVPPALAQVIQLPNITRPVVIAPLPEADTSVQLDSDSGAKVMTIEEAQAVISKLRREKREIDTRLTEALATIEQMTSRGGSLVRAYCESPQLSRNTAGGSEDCGRYRCGEVDGLCKKSCSLSSDCATGFTCSGGRCLTLGEANG